MMKEGRKEGGGAGKRRRAKKRWEAEERGLGSEKLITIA